MAGSYCCLCVSCLVSMWQRGQGYELLKKGAGRVLLMLPGHLGPNACALLASSPKKPDLP